MSLSNKILLKSHENVESLEHKNETLPEENMFPQKLSMKPMALKAEQESLEQDTESLQEVCLTSPRRRRKRQNIGIFKQ